MLEEVGLADRGKGKYKTYSLGMKQRLAIAATLLKDPDLLIFDEPTNGLDPAGIHEIRATMRGLADRGKTVLVSSHILSEVEQVADTVTIIGRGHLLAEGTVAEILARGAESACRVVVADPERAGAHPEADRLRRRDQHPDQSLTVRPSAPGQPVTDPARITETLAREGLYVRELIPVRPDLEQVFLSLTVEQQLGVPGATTPYPGRPQPTPTARPPQPGPQQPGPQQPGSTGGQR